MTIYLRNEKNQTLLDVDVFVKKEGNSSYVELKSSIDIRNYSILLIKNLDKKISLINDFEFLSELRGWLWENYFSSTKNTEKEYTNVVKELKNIISEIGTKYNLHIVED